MKNKTIRNKLMIASSTILIIAGFVSPALLLPKPASATELFGVDFQKIDWSKVCPSVQPISVANCTIVHPTSAIARKFKSGFEGFSNSSKRPNCENQKKIYEKRIAASPKRCASIFRTTYSALVISNRQGVFTASEFRDKYLADGIVDINAIPKQ